MSDFNDSLEKELTDKIPEVQVHAINLPEGNQYGGSKVLKAMMISSRGDSKEVAESARLDIEPESSFGGIGHDIIEPPFDPAVWSLSGEQSTRLTRAANAWSRNTVGLGWRIVPKDPEGNVIDTKELKGSLKSRFDKERAQLQALFRFPNKNMPFTRVMHLVKWDEEMSGNGYMEVVRNTKGRITSLYHIPSYSIRIRKGDRGLVQVRGDGTTNDGLTYTSIEPGQPNFRYFKWFGDDASINRDTGVPGSGRMGPKKRATEIIQFKVYTPRSMYYGGPRYIATAPAVSGNRLAAERNVNFFENDAVPRGILFVEGGHLDSESVERIEKFIRIGAQGVENAGRLLVLQLEPKRTAMGNEGNQSMKFQPLTVGVTEDASFLKYRSANDEEIREAFGLAESFFRTDTVNRASAEIGRATTNEQEFEPDRREKEFILNHTIVTDESWEGGPMQVASVEFRRPEISDPVDKARVLSLYASAGALSPNDVRREMGRDPYPDEMEFANKPFAWALAELQAGLIGLNGDPTDSTVEAGRRVAEAQATGAEQQSQAIQESVQGSKGEEAPKGSTRSKLPKDKKQAKNPDKRVGGAAQQNLRPERTVSASAPASNSELISKLISEQTDLQHKLLEEFKSESEEEGTSEEDTDWSY
jgi:capsid portal protein